MIIYYDFSNGLYEYNSISKTSNDKDISRRKQGNYKIIDCDQSNRIHV